MKEQEKSKPKNLLTRAQNYFGDLEQKFHNFLERHRKFKKVWNFLTNHLVVRIIGLVLAIVVTVLSGGTVPTVIALTATFLGSMVAILAIAKQLSSAEKINQQRLIATKIEQDELRYKAMLNALSPEDRAAFYKNCINSKLEDKKIHQIGHGNSSGILKGIRNSIRDTGIENILPMVPYILKGDVIGSTFYGLFCLFVTVKEVGTRIELGKRKDGLRSEVNDLCRRNNIKEYKNTRDLFIYYLEKKSDFEALELTIRNGHKFDPEMFKLHKNIIFSKMLHTELNNFIDKKYNHGKVADLQEPSFWRCLLFVINPWKKIDTSMIYEKYKLITPSPSPSLLEAKNVPIPKSVTDGLSGKTKTTPKSPPKPKDRRLSI